MTNGTDYSDADISDYYFFASEKNAGGKCA